MTPFSYDYKNRTLCGVIVNGVPYYDVTSVLECVGYNKPKGRSGWGGKMYYLIDHIPAITRMRIKQRLYCMRGGVFYLFDALLSQKQLHDRDGKKAFFEWFKQLTTTTAPGDPNVITMPEQAPADDAAPTVEELQEMLAERNHKLDAMSEQLSAATHNIYERQATINKLQGKLDEMRDFYQRVITALLNLKEA